MRTILLVLVAAVLAGCGAATPTADPSPDPKPAAIDPVAVPTTLPSAQTRPAVTVIDLSLYQIVVPAGAISGNKDFWQPLDSVGSDLADKNGIRIGQGNVNDWPRFKEILDHAGANTVPNRYIAPSATDQEIPVTGELPEQTLFCFDSHGLSGHVYDQCQNLLVLGFQPTPGNPAAVRLELCPLVRATRHHYQYTVLNDQSVVDFTSDEHLYDLGLRVDLPREKFLVVAPSPQSERATSIGHQFLTQDGKSGRTELVLIFVVNPVTH
jgi:hypothetical protein